MFNKRILFLVFMMFCTVIIIPQKKFLFDATKGEMLGNADWIIDTDSKDNPQRYPTPAQSTVTASTAETYWTGALSSWGIALVKAGHSVETLPTSLSLTYGNNTNVQDLKNYDVLVIDEPNIAFDTTEKKAIVNFVKNGGGLFMISDHAGADRNNDGWDPVRCWNDLLRNNGVAPNPFGFMLDSVNFSQTTTKVNTDAADLLINGPQGKVTSMMWSNGTSAHIQTSTTGTAYGAVWMTTGTVGGTTSIMALRATYGTGRVVFVGDSSPADDGTGQSGKSLYTGWSVDAGGNHAIFHMNASLWLAKVTGVVTDAKNRVINASEFALGQNYPNPFNPSTVISYNVPTEGLVTLKVYDIMGSEVASLVNEVKAAGSYNSEFKATNLPSGTYVYRLTAGNAVATKKMILLK